MSKNSMTKDMVFVAAAKIARTGDMPTVAQVRAELGSRGSISTIHKYLQEWKTLLLKHAARIGQNSNLSLLDENNTLRQNIDELMQNLSDYTIELQNLETANTKLEQENLHLLQESTKNKVTIASLQAENVNLRSTIEHNSAEHQQTLDKIIIDKNQTIQSLQDEMRQMQMDAIEKIREYSFKGMIC